MSYELVRHLATGGMAELFLARRRDEEPTAPHVVLKRILAAHVRGPQFVTMFLDEARLVARLDHPNVARLLDIGHTSDSYFYTMEYVHGENVRELLRRARARDVRVPIEVSLSIVAAAAAGLHAAHELRDGDGRLLGTVHRDVSPSNVMVAHDGAVKVVDFGVATADDRMTETRTGTVKGTIAYLSPEQCRLRPIDRRSDVFALGIVAWELLTQQRLFRYECDYDAMHAIVAGPIVPPSAVCDDIAPWLDAVVLRALERDPEGRPQTAAELRHAIVDGARQEGLEIGPSVIAAYMATLFGSPPLPWLDPAFAPQPPADGDVSTREVPDVAPPVTAVTASALPRDRDGSTLRMARRISASAVQRPRDAAPADPTPEPRGWSTTIATGAAAVTMVTLAVVLGLGGSSAPPSVSAPPTVAIPTANRVDVPEPHPPITASIPPASSDVPTDVEHEMAASRRAGASAVTSRRSANVSTRSRPSASIPDASTTGGASPSFEPSATSLDRARTAATEGAWRAAADACKEGLRSRPSDVELTAICARAACELGGAAVARHHIGRLPAARARDATAVCLERGTFLSSTECVDDPTRCR